MDKIDKLSEAHWEFIEALIELARNDAMNEYLFREGFKHGYKHAYEQGYKDGFNKQYPPSQDALRGVDESDGLSPACVVLECGQTV